MSLRLLDPLFRRTRIVGVDINGDELTYVCGYFHKGFLHIEYSDKIKYKPGMLVPLPRGYKPSDMRDLHLLDVTPK